MKNLPDIESVSSDVHNAWMKLKIGVNTEGVHLASFFRAENMNTCSLINTLLYT